VTVFLWRIAPDTPDYEADDLSGAGAKKTGGRWNEAGVPILYTSETQALACLETIVHLNAGGLPLNRYLVRISIPEELWSAAQQATHATLPVGWDARPAGRVSIKYGTDWAHSSSSALLRVPSVIVPDEYNVLINPAHAAATTMCAEKIRRWEYDPRVLRP